MHVLVMLHTMTGANSQCRNSEGVWTPNVASQQSSQVSTCLAQAACWLAVILSAQEYMRLKSCWLCSQQTMAGLIECAGCTGSTAAAAGLPLHLEQCCSPSGLQRQGLACCCSGHQASHICAKLRVVDCTGLKASAELQVIHCLERG